MTASLRESGPSRRSVLALAVFGLLTALGLGLWNLARVARGLDHRLLVNVVAERTHSFTTLAHASSALGRSWVLIVTALIFAGVLFRRLGWRALGPLIAVLGAQQLQNVIKWLVHRPRPAVPHLEHVTGSSFPSGHATESAAVGIALILLTCGARPRLRLAATVLVGVLVALISASRVYLGVHYPTDVVAGIMLGCAWGATASFVVGPMRSVSK